MSDMKVALIIAALIVGGWVYVYGGGLGPTHYSNGPVDVVAPDAWGH